MIVSELIKALEDYIKKNPDGDRDIFWAQLDVAATPDNILIQEKEEMLTITNGAYSK